MNLINFVNLESASQPIEGLGVEGKAGIFPMEAGLAGDGEGKAFGTTFKEQLKRDGLEHGLKKRESTPMKENPMSQGGKSSGEGTVDLNGEQPARQGSLPIPVNRKAPASDTTETGEGRLHGRLTDWNLDVPVADLPRELMDAVVQEASSTGGEPEVAETLDSRSTPTDTNTGEAPDARKAPEGNGNGSRNEVPVASGNAGKAVPVSDWMPGDPADPETLVGRKNPNGEQRPVSWTREHVSGEKLLPERTERPDVPQQAQARFVRGTSVPSAAENLTQPTLDPAAPSTENPDTQTHDSSKTFGSKQALGQTVPEGRPSLPDGVAAGKTNPVGERPEVPPQAQARFVREGEAPERPEVPQQAQARFVREGEASPERPEVPPQAQAKFVRESRQSGNPANQARSTETTVRQAADPVSPVVVSESEREGATRDGNQQVGKEQARRSPWARPSITREPVERTERPSANVRVQGQDKLEIPQNTERIAEIRERIPVKAAAPARSQLFQPQQTTAQSQVSANAVPQGNTPAEVTDTAIPEAVPNSPAAHRRESPRDRYNRLAEAKSVSTESVASQDKEAPGSQKDLVDPTRRAATFMVGRDKDSSKKEHSKDVQKAEDQNSRSEKSASIQGRSQGAFRPQTVQLSSVNDAFLKIMSTVERIAQNAITSRVHLNIDLENGEKMKVMLKVAKGHVQTVFMTDSDGLRGAMKEGWEQFQRQLSEKGFASSEPEFRGNGQDRENGRQQTEKSWDDLLDDTGFARPKGIQPAATDADSPPVDHTTPSPAKHALDAYA